MYCQTTLKTTTMTIQKALQITRKLLKEYGLEGWSATTNRRKRAFGVCNYTKQQIELSSILVPLMMDEGIMDTILHEIAHALTPGHNHDRVWKSKFIQLGGTGERVSGDWKYKNPQLKKEKVKTKYTLRCPECGNETPYARKPKRSYSCGKHGKKFDPKYKLEIIQNY